MNLFKAAMHPVSFWTSLMQVGALILVMAEIFSGLASMPWWLMMKVSSFPDGTPKTHLFRLSFQRYSRKDCWAYIPGTHARKEEDGLLLEFPCNPTRTCSM
jgi:hypothetical protein